MPACATGSKVEDAAQSRHCLRSVDTLETVVVRYGEGSWPEAGCGPSSPGLGNSDPLASGPAESPVELWTDVYSESAVGVSR